MDYEKKYNEALERAKKIHNEILNNEILGFPDQIREIFPELRGSEDERIRKWLADYFSSIKATVWIHRDITCEQILDWLEKQKDASKAIEAVDRIDKYIDEHLANAHDMKDSNPDKKYYRGWDDALGKMAGILQDVYSEKQKEQKPAEWNKATINGEPISTENQSVDIPLVEWSEEDEKMLSDLRNTLGCLMNAGAITFKTKKKFSNWLKSLRPQYHGDVTMTEAYKMGLEAGKASSWKPSEEQMEALNFAITYFMHETNYKNPTELRELYDDLLKLK